MSKTERTKLRFYGVDGWDRPIFVDYFGDYYKSVVLILQSDPKTWDMETWNTYLDALHTTDGPDGEPGYRIDKNSFEFIVPAFGEETDSTADEEEDTTMASENHDDNTMSSITELTVTVGRTVQERPYEPYTISVAAKCAVSAGTDTEEIDSIIAGVRTHLEGVVDAACTARKEAAVEPAKYY